MTIDTTKFTSRDEITNLIKPGGIGVELGVAEGRFSEKLLRKSKLSLLYSIDIYAGDRGHDESQYRQALKRLEPFKERSKILRMRFDEAVKLFPDNYFDFIYVDGYAHTGQEDGRTLDDWYPKLKSGGIFSGDDYSPKWQKNMDQINKFVTVRNLPLHIIKDWSFHTSWVTLKS